MLNSLRNIQSLFRSHGLRWLSFRVGYALSKRTGIIRWQMPAYRWHERPLATWLKKGVPSTPQAYTAWRNQNPPQFFLRVQNPENALWDPQIAVNQAEKILSGNLKYFSHTYHHTGFPPNWHTDPVTGSRLDSHKHWSRISDDPGVDIKMVWEPSRFAMVYPLFRAYASTRDERYADAFWKLIQAWAESNPPNTGPNWMDGQEAALRLIAWTFGFHAFQDSPSTTPERVAQFVTMFAAHAERIYKNIAYAVSTHSNHAISEAAGLWLTGLLFPEFKNAEKYLSLGRDLLEREAAAQIFPDGTYSMYSLNYHRFVLHVYLYAIRLGELHQHPLSSLVYDRVSASMDYIAQLIDLHTGQMPVYGSNDGALVLPLNNCDFNDYRPLLQLGSYITKKQFLLEPGPWDEDLFWLCGKSTRSFGPFPLPISAGHEGKTSFPDGGTYLLRGSGSKAIIRCSDHRSRPSHADQLHVDLWMRGQNIACDAGTYLYSGEGHWRNGLAHTAVHNTVTVDRLDQMKMLTRFTWTEWSKGKVLSHDKTTWQGEHDGYRCLTDPVSHRRSVLSLQGDRWLVIDHLTAAQSHHYALHWLLTDGEYGFEDLTAGPGLWLKPSDSLLSDFKVQILMGVVESKGNFSIARADPNSTRGWRSRYYAHKEPAISTVLETEQTSTCFWTYFGLRSDTVKMLDGTLHIGAEDWKTTIRLGQLKRTGHA